jgi:hypothetical protein
LTSGTPGDPGVWYRVIIAGNTNLDGITDWGIGDIAVFNEAASIWIKIDNTEPVPEPSTFGEMFFQNNAAETVIAAINTPVKINGAYVAGELQGMTHNAGVLTYNGAPDTLIVIATTTESYNLVNADTTMKIAKDGAPIATSGQKIGLFGTTPDFNKNTVMKLVPVVNGSTISAFTENNGGGVSVGTENITHRDLHVIAFSIGAGSSAESQSGIPALIVAVASGISGGVGGVSIINPFYIKVGNIVRITCEFQFTGTTVNPFFSVTVPFSPGFVSVNNANGVSDISFQSTTTLSDSSKMDELRGDGADRVAFDMFTGNPTGAYKVRTDFTYQIQ